MVPMLHSYQLRVSRKGKEYDEVPGDDEDSEGECRTENDSEIKEGENDELMIMTVNSYRLLTE